MATRFSDEPQLGSEMIEQVPAVSGMATIQTGKIETVGRAAN
jgi:hypothetical protein